LKPLDVSQLEEEISAVKRLLCKEGEGTIQMRITPERLLSSGEQVSEAQSLPSGSSTPRTESDAERLSRMLDECTVLKTFFEHCPVLMGLVELTDSEGFPLEFERSPASEQSDGAEPLFKVSPKCPPAGSRTLFANPAMAEYLGQASRRSDRGETEQAPSDRGQFSAPHMFERFAEACLDALRRRSTVEFAEDRECPDGRCLFFTHTVFHVHGAKFGYITQDVTPNRLHEEQLQKSQTELQEAVRLRTTQFEEAVQVKSRFLATISHEIRTPLAGIMGSMTLLHETMLNAEQQSLLSIAHVCGEQLLVVSFFGVFSSLSEPESTHPDDAVCS
jgi:hypothetical protein